MNVTMWILHILAVAFGMVWLFVTIPLHFILLKMK